MPNRRQIVTALALGLLPACAQSVLGASHDTFTRTKGGKGGRIIRVTTLKSSGEGSLKAALEAKGPRIVVFEVGGIIDLGKSTLEITEPFLTIKGDSAPHPGITIIKGGLRVTTHDVVIEHLSIRPGNAGMAVKSGFEPDCISLWGAKDVIVKNCSLTWAVDEALSASGPRFQGNTPEEWRKNTSQRISFLHNLIAHSLHDSSHAKGPHSMGSLIHDHVGGVLIYGNLYAHNSERHPLMKGAAQAAIINNVFINPGKTCVQYTLVDDQWKGRALETGQMVLIGNLMRAGSDTREGLSMLTFGGSGDLALYEHDNLAFERDGTNAPIIGYYQARSDGHDEGGPYIAKAFIRPLNRAALLPKRLRIVAAQHVEKWVYARVGARPWARSLIDQRIIRDAKAGTGRIINSQDEVGGYEAL